MCLGMATGYIKPKKKIYVCSPYSGNVERNVEYARKYCRFVVQRGFIPIAPHLFSPQFLDDKNPEERKLGMSMAKDLLKDCEELWVFSGILSEGMKAEIELANKLGIEIVNIPGGTVHDEW